MLKASGKPQPFKRPSISLDEPEVKRSWRHVTPLAVSPGDVVADLGRVKAVEPTPTGHVVIHNLYGDSRAFSIDAEVFAFVPESLAE